MNNNSEGNPTAVVDDFMKANQGKVTGIIIPPPEIRAVVDKTAQFVARNGKSFENKILQSSEGKTAKFNFMKAYDPYHAYYEFKIREFEEGLNSTNATAQPSAVPVAPKADVEPPKDSTTLAQQPASTMISKASIASPFAKFALNKPTEAPPAFEFILAHPTGLSALDVDIIKLTAQYTVVNGREFLSGLAQREQRNPQFDFLKPTHMLFSYFTSLVDAYAKVLQPTPALRSRVSERRVRAKALEAAVHRWEWARAEEDRKKRAALEADAERSAFQSIDWYDFSIVETITFGDDELLEVPGLRLAGTVTDDMDMDTDIEVEQVKVQVDRGVGRGGGVQQATPPPPPPPRAPTQQQQQQVSQPSEPMDEVEDDDDTDDIRVVSDYKPRTQAPLKSTMTMIDPISGKAVLASEMSEHMRIQLMDPRWREEQRRFQEKQQGTGYAAGSSIASSLQNFAKQRGDIFGSTEQEEAMLLEEREGRKRRDANRVIWDGHKATAATTQMARDAQLAKTPQPMPAAPPTSYSIGPSVPGMTSASAPVTIPAISLAPRSTMAMAPPPAPISMPTMPFAPPPIPAPVYAPGGGIPPMSSVMPPGMPPPMPPMGLGIGMGGGLPPMGMMMGMGMGMPPMPAGGDSGQSAAKRPKGESELVNEEEFAARFPSPISLSIAVPSDPTAIGFNLNGQIISLSVSVRTSIKDLKDQISVQLGGMASNKFQLKSGSGFLKDTQSLAALNIGPGTTVEVSMRSRGAELNTEVSFAEVKRLLSFSSLSRYLYSTSRVDEYARNACPRGTQPGAFLRNELGYIWSEYPPHGKV
eukprot:gene9053-18751_t